MRNSAQFLLGFVPAIFAALQFYPSVLSAAQREAAVEHPANGPLIDQPDVSRLELFSAAQWKRVDDGVDRGLAWLAAQQQSNGCFPTYETGETAITSLAVMAFLSRGHAPGTGPYGATIDRAIDFVVAQQRADGLLFAQSTSMPVTNWGEGSHAAMYNHGIAGLMLCEVYGMTDDTRSSRLRVTIEHALEYARKMRRPQFARAENTYAWRYFHPEQVDQFGTADLSITGWYIMFYRSARNAEFDVSQEEVEAAARYVKKCFVKQTGAFTYAISNQGDLRIGRGMTGAGLLCLLQTNNVDQQITRASGNWILEHPFTSYNQGAGSHDRFHYGAYYCSQAMFLLGGEYWKRFYPTLADTLLDNQTGQGSWPIEARGGSDGQFGATYTTALAILSLTPPYQMLPIYQR